MGIFDHPGGAVSAAGPGRPGAEVPRKPAPRARMSERSAVSRSEPILRTQGLTKRFGGLTAVRQCVAGTACRRSACRDRAQRRRQVDPDQPAVGRPAADLRPGAVRGPRHRRQQRGPDLAHRRRPQLPEDQHLPALHGVRKCAPGRAVAHAPCAGKVFRRAADFADINRRAEAALESAGLAHRAASAWRPRFRTANSASSRSPCASRRSLACCCSTNLSPAWARTSRSAWWN
jgi:hypothetical protein